MKLETADRELLDHGRIGMLAVNGVDAPVVTAGAYYNSADSIWMTTSRYAQKVKLLRRNPRASFLVNRGERSVLLQGIAEIFDLRSVSGQLRAALGGPVFYASLAGYAVKNMPFIGGYVLELDRVPSQWWPQNRLVLRLRVHRSRTFETGVDSSADPVRVPAVQRDVARRLARTPLAHACWKGRGGLVLEPCYWAVDEENLIVAFPDHPSGPNGREMPATVVVEKHHPFRPTSMVGVSFRGRLTEDQRAMEKIADRYGFEDSELRCVYRMEAARVNSWKGFETESHRKA